MPYHILQLTVSGQPAFVQFWSQQYHDINEDLYTQNIAIRPPTSDSVRELFRWKNGGQLSERKRQSVEQHFVGRLNDLQRFDGDFEPAGFLHHFHGSGPIWRIFFLHIHQPERFPIFDQHVFRAMRYIQTDGLAELPFDPEERIRIYDKEYRGFHTGFGTHQDRAVDKALWAFGKFLKLHYRFNQL